MGLSGLEYEDSRDRDTFIIRKTTIDHYIKVRNEYTYIVYRRNMVTRRDGQLFSIPFESCGLEAQLLV